MGFNDPDAAKIKKGTRGVRGASMPSRRKGDPRQYRSAAPLLSEHMLGDGLYLTNDGLIAVDFDTVAQVQAERTSDLTVWFMAEPSTSVADTPTLAERLFLGASRHVCVADLTGMRQVLFFVGRASVAGAAASTMEAKYALAYSNVAADYSQLGQTPVRVSTFGTLECARTDPLWIDLVPEARTLVHLTLITAGGDGSSPTYGSIGAYFRR